MDGAIGNNKSEQDMFPKCWMFLLQFLLSQHKEQMSGSDVRIMCHKWQRLDQLWESDRL